MEFIAKTAVIKDLTLHKKMKFSIKEFFSKYDQIRSLQTLLISMQRRIQNPVKHLRESFL